MVFGRVVRPPSPGAQLLAVDEAAIRGLAGVVAVVRDGSFRAVAAEREEQAIRAREALARSARWAETESLPPTGDALYRHMMSSTVPGETVVEKTSPLVAAPVKTLEALYTRPYQCHGSIGPSCAVAQWQDGKLAVWTHSQGVFPLRAELGKALGIPPRDIRCIHAEGAGCYGHNGAHDVALDAALLARAARGRPVQVQWMRDDEFAWAPCGPAMALTLSASLASDGSIVNWQHELWSNGHSGRPGRSDSPALVAAWHLARPFKRPAAINMPLPAGAADRNAVPLYDFPSQRVVNHYVREMPVRTSALRSLGAYANEFAIESFMDELADAAGFAPLVL